MEIVHQKLPYLHEEVSNAKPAGVNIIAKKANFIYQSIRSIGFTQNLDEYEKRKLGVFNQLNFLQLLTGLIVPISGILSKTLSINACIVASLPPVLNLVILILNSKYKHNAALIGYFLLHPFLSSMVYLNGMNLGIELFFILYSVYSIFFLKDIGYIIFTIAFSMINYFILSVLWNNFQYSLATANLSIYIFNNLLAIVFIFYGLFLIKKENTGYQFSILAKNRMLHKNNLKIQKQKTELAEKAQLLQHQTNELQELNTVKNRLFSIVAHDLKLPMYAIRNLFQNMYQNNIKAEEIKTMLPDVVNDLNYTVSLMENLLQWSRCQMNAFNTKIETVDVSEVIKEVTQLLNLQATAKNISIDNNSSSVYVKADKEMISLVLRNLVSNAIKFTDNNGIITIGTNQHASFAEVYVQDNGKGISNTDLLKIVASKYYTTAGTASETGTGLGLMLCRDFLEKNKGHLFIESKVGEGSTFSFTLPAAN